MIIQTLRESLKRMHGNDDKLVDITGNRSRKQRSMIKDAYKDLFAESQPDLIQDFKSELTGNMEHLIVGCYRDTGEYDSRLMA